MTTAVQHRRGTTAEHSSFTGLEGEVTIDTTKDTAVIHDGTLAGGYPLAKENLANVTTSGLSSIDGASTASDDKFFIYDQSATTLKTITRAELNNAIEQDALANVAITGGTINGTAIGGSTAAAGAFTTLSASSTVTLSGGTANGVAYLNGSKVVTSGSALTFDGTKLTAGSFGATGRLLEVYGSNALFDGAGQFDLIMGDGGVAYMSLTTTDNATALKIRNYSGNSDIAVFERTTGYVGIGTSSPDRKLSVYTTDSAGKMALFSNGNTNTNLYLSSDPSSGGGVINVSNNAASAALPLLFQGNGTTRMTLDSSGNLALGVAPSAAFSAARSIEVGYVGSAFWSNGANDVRMSANVNYNLYAANGLASTYVQSAGVHYWYNAPSGTAGNAITFSQAMTLDASGNLLVGATSFAYLNNNSVLLGGGDSAGQAIIQHVSGTSTGSTYAAFTYNAGAIGSITQTGTTAVLYNTTSDQRLKENIQDSDSASTLIDSLQVRQFDWKADGSHQRYGFVAQELVTVAPEAVHQPEDAEEMMAVDYSKLVPMLVKEIQSLRVRVAQLESN